MAVVAEAFAGPPAPPGFPYGPGAPFEPVTVMLPAKAGAMPAASKPSGSAAVTSSRRNDA
jgi:hypothetical protein